MSNNCGCGNNSNNNIIPPGSTILYDVFGNEYYTLPSGQVIFLKSGTIPNTPTVINIIGTSNRIDVTNPSTGVFQVDIDPNFILNILSGLTINTLPIATSGSTLGNSWLSQSNTGGNGVKIASGKLFQDSTGANSINMYDGSLGGGITINTSSNGLNTDVILNSGTISSNSGINIGLPSTELGYIQLYNASTGYVCKIQPGSTASNIYYTLPTIAPTNGQLLSSTSGGTWSWVDPSLKVIKVTLTSAQILQLNTTPITIIAAPGVGYAISVIDCVMNSTYNSVPYATNTNLDIISASGSTYQKNFTINYTSNYLGYANNTGVGNGTVVANDALVAKARTGNPTAGNSDIILYLSYRIIAL